MKDILEVYARRWRVENKLAELVAFFNLNALSSPIMICIHFDIFMVINGRHPVSSLCTGLKTF
ncbi:MAG: hypothetical protein ACKVE4_00375 [Dissulfuribacterales bacterium]